MDELIRLVAPALSYLDERMGRYTTRMAQLGIKGNDDFLKAYQRSKRDLNDALARRKDFQSIAGAANQYLAWVNEFLKASALSSDEVDEHLRRTTAEAVQDYIYRIREYEELENNRDSLQRELQLLRQSFESQREAVGLLETRLREITNSVNTVYGPAQRQYDYLQSRLEEDINYIDGKKREIESLAGLVTGQAITSSYQRSAISEKKVANDLRNASLGCMALVIIVVAVSFFYATTEFNLTSAIFRMGFAVFLSVPAAYLARESAKHRAQQYTHLQTALDVQAITPYIASLPLEMQHKLKEEMASRIFVAKSYDHVLKESYPINLQDIILAAFNAAKKEKGSRGSKSPEADEDSSRGK